MPTRNYTRKNDPNGNPADPAKGSPSFLSGVLTALSGRTWRSRASGTGVILDIDGAEPTAQEDTDLTAAHTAWVTMAPFAVRKDASDVDASEYSTTQTDYPATPQKSFTTPVLMGGIYHLGWQAKAKTDWDKFPAWLQVEVDGTVIGETQVKFEGFGSHSGFTVLSFDTQTSHTIDFYLRADQPTETAYCKALQYSLWRTS